MTFPTEQFADTFYGNPRGVGGASASVRWQREVLVYVKVPFAMTYAGKSVSRISCHRKCEHEFREWLNIVWRNASFNHRAIRAWGMNIFNGSFVYREKRGSNALSMHAYGCAFDFDAPRNALGDRTPHFGSSAEIRQAVVAPFEVLGGEWGGDWKRPDGMHFQFIRTK